jgi:polyisoprenoid-binding protein YceI
MRGMLTTLAVVLIAGPALADAPLWEVDRDASRIGFTGEQNGNAVEGRFERYDATVRFDPDDLAGSSIRLEIATGSAVVEGGGEREEILSASAWFHVEDFPRAVFTADRIEPTDTGYRALGTLELKGVTREVPVDFTVDIADGRAVAEGRAELIRNDFGVGPDGALFGVEVAPDVVVDFHLEATRAE